VEVSSDLSLWKSIKFGEQGKDFKIDFSTKKEIFRYLRIYNSSDSVAEIDGFYNGKPVDRSDWRASNLFGSFAGKEFSKAWAGGFTLNEIAKKSYLAIPIPGKYSGESVYAAIRVNGKLYGATDRSISYPSNTWEAPVYPNFTGDYTYYVPLKPEMKNKHIEVVVIGISARIQELKSEVWITTYPVPFEKKKLNLE